MPFPSQVAASWRRSSRKRGMAFNIINTTIGSGILSLPFVMRLCGLGLGVGLLVSLGLLVLTTLRYLVVAAADRGLFVYEHLTSCTLGASARKAVAISTVVITFAACVSYIVILADISVPLVASITGSEQLRAALRAGLVGAAPYEGTSATEWRTRFTLVFFFLFILPLSLVQTMDKMTFASGLSVLSIAFLVVLVIVAAFKPEGIWDRGILCDGVDDSNNEDGDAVVCNFGSAEVDAAPSSIVDVVLGIPIIAFAFAVHTSMLLIMEGALFHGQESPTTAPGREGGEVVDAQTECSASRSQAKGRDSLGLSAVSLVHGDDEAEARAEARAEAEAEAEAEADLVTPLMEDSENSGSMFGFVAPETEKNDPVPRVVSPEDVEEVLSATRYATMASIVVYASVGIAGYLTFGNRVPENLLVGLLGGSGEERAGAVVTLIRFFFFISVSVTYPMAFIPFRTSLIRMVYKSSSDTKMLVSRRAGLRISVGLSVLTLIVALGVPGVAIVFQIGGATGSMCTAYIIPCLLKLYLIDREKPSVALRAAGEGLPEGGRSVCTSIGSDVEMCKASTGEATAAHHAAAELQSSKRRERYVPISIGVFGICAGLVATALSIKDAIDA